MPRHSRPSRPQISQRNYPFFDDIRVDGTEIIGRKRVEETKRIDKTTQEHQKKLIVEERSSKRDKKES